MTTLIVMKTFEDNAGRSDSADFGVVQRKRGDRIDDKDMHRQRWHPRFLDWLTKNGYVRAEGATDAATAPVIRPSWMYGP